MGNCIECGETVDIEEVMASYGKKKAEQACLDMIKYMEEKRSEWNDARPFIHEFRASQILSAAKEYLKTL